ncbi:DUF2975 domain-containing protein [Nesterenkonia ebinurensis]|uniref:DUF2975 domain-containing protein n=1 Tax=Nesterenkonia ebinurensis TaxID=2608252 RepID=UPI00123CC632|nr:DUF2975 domain-containing protein [Nesterenkonia ebinurensis]
MTIQPWVVWGLRLLLILLFVGLAGVIALVPDEARWQAQAFPEQAHWEMPFTIIAIFWILCLQAVLLCTWMLLNLVNSDRIFTRAALPWVNTILVSIAVVWVSVGGVGLFLELDQPTILSLYAVAGLLVVTVVGLLMIVMRALLIQATTLRAEMEAVI